MLETVEIGDEPVAKVLYPHGSDLDDSNVWFECGSWFIASDRTLHIEAGRSINSEIGCVSNEVVEFKIKGDETRFYAA